MLDNESMLRLTSGPQRVAERLIEYLPASKRSSVRRRFRERLVNDYISKRVGPSFQPVDRGPAAPPELVAQTSAMRAQDVESAAAPDEYFGGGYLGLMLFLRLLERSGFNLRTLGSVLDFGCGNAKVIRLLRCINGVRLVGCDVNPAQIEWDRANVPGVTFFLSRLEPPLEFAADDEFDLIIAASVFTHIPLDAQSAWIAEMRRVLRPGGYFLCTLAGAAHAARQLSPEQRTLLEQEGRFTLVADDPGASHATKETRQWDVFQTRSEVIEAFSPHLEIVDYVTDPFGQDNLVLRRA